MLSLKITTLLAFMANIMIFNTAQVAGYDYGFAVLVALDSDEPGCNPINNGAQKKLDEFIDYALDKAEQEGVIGSTELPAPGAGEWYKFYSHNGHIEELSGSPVNRKLLAQNERRLSCRGFCAFMCISVGNPIYCPCCPARCCARQRRFLRVETDAEVQPATDRVEGLILEALYASEKDLRCVKQDPFQVDIVFKKEEELKSPLPVDPVVKSIEDKSPRDKSPKEKSLESKKYGGRDKSSKDKSSRSSKDKSKSSKNPKDKTNS